MVMAGKFTPKRHPGPDEKLPLVTSPKSETEEVLPLEEELNKEEQSPQTVVGLDHVAAAIHAQADLGIENIDDFHEGDFIETDTGVPKELLEKYGVIGNVKMTYIRISREGFMEHPFRQHVIPVSRANFSELPVTMFNVENILQQGDLIVCGIPTTRLRALKAMGKRRINQNIAALAPRTRQPTDASNPEKPVGGRITTGALSEEVGTPNTVLRDDILAAVQEG